MDNKMQMLMALVLALMICSCTQEHDGLQVEAQAAVDKLFEGYVVRCGDSVYGFKDKKGKPGSADLGMIYEFNVFSPIAVVDPVEKLTTADRLNRNEYMKQNNISEPEWTGKIHITIGANRTYYKGRWSGWKDHDSLVEDMLNTVAVKKQNGKWSIVYPLNNNVSVGEVLESGYSKINCAEIPK